LLFGMGVHSTLFGPAKYSIIPQHVPAQELTHANAWVETGTFLAILLGNLIAGLVFETTNPTVWVSSLLILFAVFGWQCSRKIPLAPTAQTKSDSTEKTTTLSVLQAAYAHRTLFLSMLGISWFWFLGAAYLTQLPEYTKTFLMSQESVMALLLIAFSIGICLGSFLCHFLSGNRVEIGLVPLGALGLSLFGIDLGMIKPLEVQELFTMSSALTSETHWRVFIDLLLIGISGGLYIVPLYSFIQERSEEKSRARMIAANNILNALFMVMSALTGIFTLVILKISLADFFLLLVVLNFLVSIYIFTVVPEFVVRFMMWCIIKIMYRVKGEGLEHLPKSGGAIIVSNHVSYVDALIIGGLSPRPVRFIMYKPIYELPLLNFIFRVIKAIPIDSKTKNPEAYEKAFDEISKALKNGELICIFPEGKLTLDGEVGEFKTGLLRILEKDPVPVIPTALCGLWGSFFSHKGKPALTRLPKRFWSRVSWKVAEPIAATQVEIEKLRNQIIVMQG
ncbi:MAG: MFS transporter, partial [Pseudomonadota bacterium]